MAALITTRGLGRAGLLLATAGLGLVAIGPTTPEEWEISLSASAPLVMVTGTAPQIGMDFSPDLAVVGLAPDLSVDSDGPVISLDAASSTVEIEASE